MCVGALLESDVEALVYAVANESRRGRRDRHPARPAPGPAAAHQGRQRDPSRRGRGALRATRRRRLTPRRPVRAGSRPAFGILSRGEVSEWLMVPLSKSGVRKHRGFESRPLRQHSPHLTALAALSPARLAHAPWVRSLRCSAPPCQEPPYRRVSCHDSDRDDGTRFLERSPSGLWRRTGNAVRGNPSRVRIPPSPPPSRRRDRGRCGVVASARSLTTLGCARSVLGSALAWTILAARSLRHARLARPTCARRRRPRSGLDRQAAGYPSGAVLGGELAVPCTCNPLQQG